MVKTSEQATQSALRKLQWKITLMSCVMIVIVLAVALFVGSISEYNSKIAFIEGQLSTAIEHAVESDGSAVIRPSASADVELDMNNHLGKDSYVPILVYKIDYDEGKLVPLDLSSGRLSESTEERLTSQILATDEGSYKLNSSSLLLMKRSYPEGDIVAITDASIIDEYMSGLLKTLVSVSLAVCLILGCMFWLLSRRMTAPVDEMWHRQQRFIADVSHELKTPVSVIMSNADIIIHETDDEDVKSRAGMIFEETEKMTQLISDMMYLLTDKAITAEKEDVNFSRICHRLAMVFEAKAWEKQMSIDDEGIDDGIHVMMEPSGLERTVSILLDNAIKYGDPASKISISLSTAGKKVQLLVADKGDVIPEDELVSIFDRFFRTDTARTRSNETSYGLGLAMANDIVTANGGEIYAESSEEQTVFTVELPLYDTSQNKK